MDGFNVKPLVLSLLENVIEVLAKRIAAQGTRTIDDVHTKNVKRA